MQISAVSINYALSQFLSRYIEDVNNDIFILEPSRNGPVAVSKEPCLTKYLFPQRRVLNCNARMANPFFHLMESIWMLQGSNDLEFVKYYNKRMEQYSDDGLTLNAAYGYRWRAQFEMDQLIEIGSMLRADPTTRRAVLQMWDANYDLGSNSKDLPCNTQVYFRVVNEENSTLLNMTVCSRSGDTFWGVYGANAVHFSMLLEYMAAMVGVGVGYMYHFVNNQHIYTEEFPRSKVIDIQKTVILEDGYSQRNRFLVQPMLQPTEKFSDLDDDIYRFLADDPNGVVWKTDFFSHVVSPMHRSWVVWKEAKDPKGAIECLQFNGATGVDWIEVGKNWLSAKLVKEAV